MPNPLSPEQKSRQSRLIKALLLLKSEDEMARFLTDLCTPQEIRTLAERLEIAALLSQDELPYREISKQTGASTTTVTRVARFLQQEPHQGYQTVLKRLAETDNSG